MITYFHSYWSVKTTILIFNKVTNRSNLPVTLVGTVCGFPILFPQNPRLTGTMDNLARMIAPRMAVATSFEH